MVLIYVKSGEWMSSCNDEWSFVVDKEKRGRMITLETTTMLEELKIDNFRSLVKGDKYDFHVDLERRTCTCGKYDIGKISCRHAIPAIYSQGMEAHRFTDDVYTTATWRTAYTECINPIPVPESEWKVLDEVKLVKLLPPETRKSAGRPIKRRYETVEDKIKSSQGSRKNKKYKCSRCGIKGHKRGSCDLPIS